MNIKDKILDYSKKINTRFAVKHYVKLEQLEEEVRRYLKRELNGDRNIQFNSQDLRILCIALEKVHKALNKKISFIEFQKNFEKYSKVDSQVFYSETKNLCHYILAVRIIQKVICSFNHHAVTTYLIEIQKDEEKIKDDEILKHAIYEALVDGSNL